MSNEFKKQCGPGMYWCNTDKVCKPIKLEEDNPRIPRKPGEPAKSDKHSDLYTDEDPKGTIHGLKFASEGDAEESIRKIKASGRSHAHKIQAAIAMEQRAKVMGKVGAAAVYRRFIESMKKKTKKLKEEWSAKYKKSINCNNPKGFSQKAHCQGKKKMNEDGVAVVPANNAGQGNIAGIGVGAKGEPGINKKKGILPFIGFVRRKEPR